MEAMRTREEETWSMASQPFHLLYECFSSESFLSRQIKKSFRVDPGGGEAGLIWEDQRLL